MTANLNIWESGDFFLNQFPFYTNFITCEANLLVYMISVDDKHESAVRSAQDFLKPTKAIIEKARATWLESITDGNEQQRDLKPKEMVLITCGSTLLSSSTEKLELIRSFAEENGIELCKELVIPDDEGADIENR